MGLHKPLEYRSRRVNGQLAGRHIYKRTLSHVDAQGLAASAAKPLLLKRSPVSVWQRAFDLTCLFKEAINGEQFSFHL